MNKISKDEKELIVVVTYFVLSLIWIIASCLIIDCSSLKVTGIISLILSFVSLISFARLANKKYQEYEENHHDWRFSKISTS